MENLKILEELDIKFVEHNRKIISPKELDFYLPDYNSAIECNGLYWHSDFKKEKAYHYDKCNTVYICNNDCYNIF